MTLTSRSHVTRYAAAIAVSAALTACMSEISSDDEVIGDELASDERDIGGNTLPGARAGSFAGTSSVCKGSTTPGNTSWIQDQANSLYVDIDTSACGFATTPLYFASMGGTLFHWRTIGATSIYKRSATGFRVYVIFLNTDVTPAMANHPDRQWHITWHATPNDTRTTTLCTGRTAPGDTNWQPYFGGLYVDVDTSACGWAATPDYFTSLGGTSRHAATHGPTSIYEPTATGFRVYLHYTAGTITPAEANESQWHINWNAVPNGTQTTDSCVGRTNPGSTNWQSVPNVNNGICVDVDTSACGLSAAPRYFTSFGGIAYHWLTSGATSIYQPSATGFRVYVFNNGGLINPATANQNQWHINWNAVH